MDSEIRELFEKLNECANRLQSAETTVTEIAEKMKKHNENPQAHQNLSWRKTITRDDDQLAEFQLALTEMSNQLVKNMSRMSEMEKEIIRLKGEIQLLKNNMG